MKNCSLYFMMIVSMVGLPQGAAPIGETITLYATEQAKYVNTNPDGDHLMSANGGSAYGYFSHYVVENAGSGTIRLLSLANHKYAQLTSDSSLVKALGTSSSDAKNKWIWNESSEGIDLKSVSNSKYIKPGNGGNLRPEYDEI